MHVVVIMRRWTIFVVISPRACKHEVVTTASRYSQLAIDVIKMKVYMYPRPIIIFTCTYYMAIANVTGL